MIHIKLFENFDTSKLPTPKELFDMFTKINDDSVKISGPDGYVALSDVEYYTDQINNIYFNNVTGDDDFETAEKLAKSMAKYAQSNNQEQKELDQITSWLKGTSEEMDDWDWDGDLLTIFLDDEPIEKYTRAELDAEGVFK